MKLHRWFDLEFDWIEVNFSTHEPDKYKSRCALKEGLVVIYELNN